MGKTRSINKNNIHTQYLHTDSAITDNCSRIKTKNRNIYGFSPIRGLYIMGELVQEIINRCLLL